jgi:hypothetical protein
METMDRKWVVSSEAGDGVNGKGFTSLDEARVAIERVYGAGQWNECSGAPDSPENAHYLTVGSDEVARIGFDSIGCG